jgi:hypothetical protein
MVIITRIGNYAPRAQWQYLDNWVFGNLGCVEKDLISIWIHSTPVPALACCMLFSLLLLLAVLSVAFSWLPTANHVFRKNHLLLSMSSDAFADLQKKLNARLSNKVSLSQAPIQSETKLETTEKLVENQKAEQNTVVTNKNLVTKASAATPTVSSIVATTKIQPETSALATKTTIVQPSQPVQHSLSVGEYAAGITLGILPYVFLPAILLNSLTKFVKKPKPLPIIADPPRKVEPYNKPLADGAKEGITELLSGKSSPDLDLTRKGIKLSLGSFALAGILTGVMFITSSVETGTEVLTI